MLLRVLLYGVWLFFLFPFVFFFFCQAEDGIRDLVRSRGLGDVYKRQAVYAAISSVAADGLDADARRLQAKVAQSFRRSGVDRDAVSYTHLTLPTSDLV